MSSLAKSEVVASALSESPYPIDKLKMTPGGVDFLGLRNVNLDMMDEYFPGINNVTWYIRFYSVIAWAWWRAAENAEAAGKDPTDVELREFVERVETLFTWSHKLDGRTGLPGIDATPNEASEPYRLEFSNWGRLAGSTDIMAAVQYGPSVKAPNGIGYLIPKTAGVFAVNEKVMPAVQAIDEVLRRFPIYSKLETLESFTATSAEVSPLIEAWRIDTPTAAERDTFRALFYVGGGAESSDGRKWKRHNAIELLLEFMRQASEALTPDQFRNIAVRRRLPDGTEFLCPASLEDTLTTYSMLQVRQAQRLALEGLLSWTEGQVAFGGIRSTEDLVRKIQNSFQEFAVDLAQASTLGSAFEAAKIIVDKQEPVGLMETMVKLEECAEDRVRREEMPADIFKLLLLCVHLTQNFATSDIGQRLARHGQDPRISLDRLVQSYRDFESRPVRDFIQFVLEAFVLAQHFVTAVRRNVDDTQRLRVVLEENGLAFLARQPLGFHPTPDRLETGLSLMAQSGLCKMLTKEGVEAYKIVST